MQHPHSPKPALALPWGTTESVCFGRLPLHPTLSYGLRSGQALPLAALSPQLPCQMPCGPQELSQQVTISPPLHCQAPAALLHTTLTRPVVAAGLVSADLTPARPGSCICSATSSFMQACKGMGNIGGTLSGLKGSLWGRGVSKRGSLEPAHRPQTTAGARTIAQCPPVQRCDCPAVRASAR